MANHLSSPGFCFADEVQEDITGLLETVPDVGKTFTVLNKIGSGKQPFDHHKLPKIPVACLQSSSAFFWDKMWHQLLSLQGPSAQFTLPS